MRKKIVLAIAFYILHSTFYISQAAEPYFVSTEAKLEYNQGVDFYKVGQYERAMAAFRRAINIDPNYIDAYFNLGSIMNYLGQYDAALSVFKQIIVRKPDDYESLYKAAEISVRLEQPEKAKTFLAAIPPTSTVYVKAQELASAKLQTNMQAIKAAQVIAEQENSSSMDDSAFTNISSPTGISADGAGNVYVASFSDNTIYKITPEGSRMMFLKDPKLNGPIGMVTDGAGNIYIANYNGDNILKVSPGGGATILLANVKKPYGLYISNNGKTLFITSQGSNSIVRYKL